jgi:hypothetical protein
VADFTDLVSSIGATPAGAALLNTFRDASPLSGAQNSWLDTATRGPSSIRLVIFPEGAAYESVGIGAFNSVRGNSYYDGTGEAGYVIVPRQLVTYWDSTTLRAIDPRVALAHEMFHSAQYLVGAFPPLKKIKMPYRVRDAVTGKAQSYFKLKVPVAEAWTMGGPKGLKLARDVYDTTPGNSPSRAGVNPYLVKAVEAAVDSYRAAATSELDLTMHARISLAETNPTELAVAQQLNVPNRAEFATDATADVGGTGSPPAVYRLAAGTRLSAVSAATLASPKTSAQLDTAHPIAPACAGGGATLTCATESDETSTPDDAPTWTCQPAANYYWRPTPP